MNSGTSQSHVVAGGAGGGVAGVSGVPGVSGVVGVVGVVYVSCHKTFSISDLSL
jgi:hypothetical protein